MVFSSTDTSKDKDADPIFNVINQYNTACDEDTKQIKFIHGGSSAALAFVGKTVKVTHPKESEIVVVPYALMPIRILREYGLHPMSGELGTGTFAFGSRKQGVNDNTLPGMKPDKEGVKTCYRHAMAAKRFVNVEEVHRLTLDTILEIQQGVYVRSLKKLLTYLTNMMMLDPEGSKKAEDYLNLLQNERKNLELHYPNDANIRKYFDKYIPRIESILYAQSIPFESDEKFRKEIVNQYPIIYCSTVRPNGISEVSYEGMIDLKTVKVFFTPMQYVNQLQEKLNEIGLKEIIVHGYTSVEPVNDVPIADVPIALEQNERKLAFLKATSLHELMLQVQEEAILLNDNGSLEEKMAACLAAYLDGKGEQYHLMAGWLLKNADVNALVNMSNVLARHAKLYLYDILQTKAAVDKTYLNNISHAITPAYFLRWGNMTYLRALLAIRESVENTSMLFDYSKPCDDDAMHKLIEPKGKFCDRNRYLENYLAQLQHSYVVLIFDKRNATDNLDNMHGRVTFLENKYKEILSEFKKTNLSLDDRMVKSELYQAIGHSQSENNGWLQFFRLKPKQEAVNVVELPSRTTKKNAQRQR
jgi:hypothetical protein